MPTPRHVNLRHFQIQTEAVMKFSLTVAMYGDVMPIDLLTHEEFAALKAQGQHYNVPDILAGISYIIPDKEPFPAIRFAVSRDLEGSDLELELRDIKAMTGLEVMPVYASRWQIRRFIRKYQKMFYQDTNVRKSPRADYLDPFFTSLT